MVAGLALTVNKAPGVTVEESVAIHLNGSENNRPALADGMPYVAFTRSESFHMTACCSPPSWDGFVLGWLVAGWLAEQPDATTGACL